MHGGGMREIMGWGWGRMASLSVSASWEQKVKTGNTPWPVPSYSQHSSPLIDDVHAHVHRPRPDAKSSGESKNSHLRISKKSTGQLAKESREKNQRALRYRLEPNRKRLCASAAQGVGLIARARQLKRGEEKGSVTPVTPNKGLSTTTEFYFLSFSVPTAGRGDHTAKHLENIRHCNLNTPTDFEENFGEARRGDLKQHSYESRHSKRSSSNANFVPVFWPNLFGNEREPKALGANENLLPAKLLYTMSALLTFNQSFAFEI
ncbi:hypothetical protein R3P38DRAFT_2793988 [Favolaschia claudopus]|uniref:Uncharacterized protein n=1 Tax=Favolaschia claudopus TaxID=2862362 RepID=A0AAW0ABP0_9AGAR